jgi:hypothetical protein
MKGLIFPLTALVALTACSSGTSIRVTDPDARIYINGEYLGTGHAHYSDRKPAFTVQEVTLRKDGCEPQNYRFRRNERPDIGAIIGAYYLVVPIFWTAQYKERHSYDFACEQLTAGKAGPHASETKTPVKESPVIDDEGLSLQPF